MYWYIVYVWFDGFEKLYVYLSSLPFSLSDLVASLSPERACSDMGVAKLPGQLLYGCSLVPRGGGGGRDDHTAEGTDRTNAPGGRISVGLLCGFIQLGVGY